MKLVVWKNHLGGGVKFCTEVWTFLKNGVIVKLRDFSSLNEVYYFYIQPDLILNASDRTVYSDLPKDRQNEINTQYEMERIELYNTLRLVLTPCLAYSLFDHVSIDDQNFDFLTKISIFGQNFDFWPKFRLLTKISIFGQNFDWRSKFQFLTKFSIFDQIFDFW